MPCARRTTVAALAASALVLALAAATALAAAGQLDTSFAGDGKRLTMFGNGSDNAGDLAIQPDGRIVVAGYSDQNPDESINDYDFAVARYRSNGSLDTSFSGDGKRTAPVGASTDTGSGVAIQADGKIVVAGSSFQGAGTANDFAVARFKPGGGLDDSFSGNGTQVTSFGSGPAVDFAYGVAIQPNGRIVVAGYSNQSGSGYLFAVARYLPNGNPDTSFAGDGKRVTEFGNGTADDIAADVAIQPNGRIVVAGYSDQGAADDFAVARYMPNGSLDTSFSDDGKRTIGFGMPAGADQASSVGIQPNGRIVLAGYASTGAFAVARLTPSGGLDQRFSGNGRRATSFPGGDGSGQGTDVAFQSDGKIVVGGFVDQGSTGDDFGVARFRPGGDLDDTFSQDGKRTISFDSGSNRDRASGVAIQANGRIVVAGSSEQIIDYFDFAVARLLAG